MSGSLLDTGSTMEKRKQLLMARSLQWRVWGAAKGAKAQNTISVCCPVSVSRSWFLSITKLVLRNLLFFSPVDDVWHASSWFDYEESGYEHSHVHRVYISIFLGLISRSGIVGSSGKCIRNFMRSQVLSKVALPFCPCVLGGRESWLLRTLVDICYYLLKTF